MKDLYNFKTRYLYDYLLSFSVDNFAAASSYKKNFLFTFLFACFTLLGSSPAFAQPSGFIDEKVGGDWNAAVGMQFSKDGNRLYVWEKGGKVWIVENGRRLQTPLIDISEEVGDWRDHGLLGFALDPNFESNGHFYLLYVVDRHHLMNFGKSSYNPATDEYNAATIGRLTRYTARAGDNRISADPSSRKILLGETVSTGIPVLYIGHSVGSIVFGEDGSLLLATGDGASAGYVDTGLDPANPNDTYVKQALEDGIITEEENIGAYKSQQVNSLNGKILRLDPATGNGLSNNPFYDPSNPRSAASRVWSLGFRNPFRFTIKPGTGSSTFPGVLYIGDVGWYVWEEINIADKPGMNFGWPVFEGLETQEWHYHEPVPNKFAPNPLFGQNGCDQQFFNYRDLVLQQKKDHNPYFGNPCNWNMTIADTYWHFEHTRPVIDWRHEERGGGARTGIFIGNDAAVADIGASNSPVSGSQFSGSSVTGGVWYSGDDFPAEYKNTYFFGDFAAGWIKYATFDEAHNPKSIHNFIDANSNVVAFATHPVTGGLYYINYATEIHKITYSAGNLPPNAIATADKMVGASPLTVNFTGNNSTDPEGQPLTYEWDFGDGSAVSTEPNPTHTFTANGEAAFSVTLKVTDPSGLSGTAQLTIALNNTAPIVKITSPAEGTKYPLTHNTVYNLTAEVTDKEHSGSQLKYEWQTSLHHNQHNHPEPVDNKVSTTVTLTPVGCDGAIYFYRITLKVTDAGGLSGTDYVDVQPDCSGGIIQAIAINSPTDGASFNAGSNIPLEVKLADLARKWTKVEYFEGTTKVAESTASPYSASWNNVPAGTYSLTAKATDSEDHMVESAAISVTVASAVNLPPTAVASADKLSGTSPLTINFTGNNSTDPEGQPLTYEWNFGDGSAISGEANPTHTFTTNADATYTVILKVTDASGKSATAQLAVIVQVPVPVVQITNPTNGAVYAAGSNISLGVSPEGTNRNWSKVEYYQGTTKIAESTAIPHSTVWNNVPGGSYVLKARVTNAQGQTTESQPVNITVTAGNVSEGSISREYWANVQGNGLSGIPLRTTPTAAGELTSFQAPSFIADNYGQRVRGFVTAPATGTYTFWIAADEIAELWLGTSELASSKRKIAQVESRTNSNEWTKHGSQQSAQITLEAGKRYYIEALHKEQDGDDHLSVGWKLPDGTMERPIPGIRLSPYTQESTTNINGIILYPNPFIGELTVEFTEDVEELQSITLYDMAGRIIFQQTGNIQVQNQVFHIDLKDRKITPGLYILRLIDNYGNSKVVKVKRI